MTGVLLLRISLTYVILGVFGYICESSLLKFSPEGPEIVKQINDSFYISCSGENAKNVWWYRNNLNISAEFTRVHVERKSEASTSEAGLFFSAIQSSDGGTYTCNATINNKTESANFVLRTYKPITFRDTLAVQSFWENDMAVIRCEADGEPEPSLSWFVDGKHAENFPRYQQIGDGLLVSSVTMEDENRKFICRAAAVSEITSNIAIQNIRLNVLHQPKLKGPSKISAYGYLGGRVNLTCNVDSNPPANFTWFRNNTLFTGDDNMTVVYEKNNSTLYINFVNNTWPESYLCKAENERGSTTVEFNLRKIEKPEPPKRAKIHSATHNSFQLEIHGPPTKDEDIVGYRVQIMEKKEMEKGKLWEVAREVTLLKDHPYIINDLNPNTEYVVRVTTQNRAGTGEYTNEMKTKTLRSSASSNYRVSTAFLALLTLFCLYRRA